VNQGVGGAYSGISHRGRNGDQLSFERILCPVAESHATDVGLHYAIALARSYNAKLLVLTLRNKCSARTGEAESSMRAGVKRAIAHSAMPFPDQGARIGVIFEQKSGKHK